MVRRPLAFTILGWLFIAVGAAGLLKDVLPLLGPDRAAHLAELRSQWPAELGPAWTSRFLSVIGGAGVLRGRNWARWLLTAWMVFHILLSIMHSPMQLLVHVVVFTPILYFLFRRQSAEYFRRSSSPAPGDPVG